MNKNGLKKIKRRELLELMLKQAERIKELEDKLNVVTDELNSKRIKIKESGYIASAALKLSGVFESADAAAKEYLDNVKENCNKIEFSIRKEALDEKKKIIKETEAKCKKKKEMLEARFKKREIELEEKYKKLESELKKGNKKASNKNSKGNL